MPSGFVTPASGPQTQAGTGPPIGVVTPRGIGGLYVDATHGALYIAHGVTSADWTAVGGNEPSNTGNAVGVLRDGVVLSLLAGVNRDTPLNGRGASLSDAYSQWNGSGAGLTVVGNGTDGQQALHWINDAGSWDVVDRHGTVNSPPGGIIFPTSDPHIVGVWWDNAGVLTKSLG